MQRKTIFLIIVLLAFLAGAGLFGFYYYLQHQSSNSPYSSNFSLSNFFPFGKSNSGSSSPSNNIVEKNNTVSTSSLVVSYPILRQITKIPVAGDTMIDTSITATTSTTTSKGKTLILSQKITKTNIWYVDRATGQIYETMTDDLGINRISNTTFPKVYSAYFDAAGSSTVLTTIPDENTDVVDTYYGNLVKEATSTTDSISNPTIYSLNTKLLSSRATNTTVSPDKKSIFTLLSNGNNLGVISNFDGSKQTTVWSSQISEWIPYWATSKYIIMTSKPSVDLPGFSYLLNIATKSYTRLLGDISGLTVLPSPDLSWVLYSSSISSGNLISLNIYSVKNSTSQPLSLRTLPEKCVWSAGKTPLLYCAIPDVLPSALYPDDWYKGLVSFSDSIWSLNLTTGESKRIAVLSDMAKQSIDATNLTLDSKEDYLTFVNKKDLTLWGLQIATSTATSTK